MLWVGMSGGKGFNSTSLGESVALQAMAKLGKKKADLVIVFASSRLNQKEVLSAIRSVTGNSPLIGCSGASQITQQNFDEDLVVVTLVSDSLSIKTGLGRGLRKDARKAGQEAAWAAKRPFKERGRFFLAFSDGLCGKGDDAIRGIQEALGTSFPIVGASGADDFHFERSFQYYDGQVLEDALCGAIFVGDITFGMGAGQGWLPLGRSRKITRSQGNLIQTLDGKPAISIYEDYFGERFYKNGEPLARRSLFYPLGIVSEEGSQSASMVRHPLYVDSEGALVCAGEVPERGEVRLMIGTKTSLLSATRQAALTAREALSKKKAGLVLIFESASHRKLLGLEASETLEILRDVFGETIPIAGCYDYGEKFPIRGDLELGKSYFLNESIVLLALGA